MSDLATERLQINPVRQGYVSEIEVCEKFDSFVSILNGLGKSLLSSRVKNAVIPLLQTKTADTTHTGIFARVTRTFSLSTVVSIECGHSEHIHGGATPASHISRQRFLLFPLADCDIFLFCRIWH